MRSVGDRDRASREIGCRHRPCAEERQRADGSVEIHTDALNRPTLRSHLQPRSERFYPNQYGTGIVVDRPRSDAHPLPRCCETSVTTTSLRRIIAALSGKFKAADPWHDLAMLEIEAGNLTPINFGDARSVKKGSSSWRLGNPYAIARDGQVSASWGIIANLSRGRKPIGRSNGSCSTARRLHQLGTLIQTDASSTWHERRRSCEPARRLIGLTDVAGGAAAGYEQPGWLRDSGR